MSSSLEDLTRRLLEVQGIPVPASPIDAIARGLEAQLAAERGATRAIEFEVEPSSFSRALEGGDR